MKQILLFLFALGTIAHLPGQTDNPNTMAAMIDGKEFKTEPRRIMIKTVGYITGNLINPDKSLRIWLGTIDGTDALESGEYLIVDADRPDTDKNFERAETGKYKGIAAIKYVEETKSPRMEYRVGMSTNAIETMQVVVGDDGYYELSFNVSLDGAYWKEKTSASVLGGVSRLMDKVEDKALTKATGYDQDIDPEGMGYRKMKENAGPIQITDCKVRLKIK